jgi:2-haloacid dehalogenase
MHILVFDMNETLLDLAALDPQFERYLGSASFRREWFAHLLQMAFVSTITQSYQDFGGLARAALDVVEKRHGISLSSDARSGIFETVRNLPPHPDVADGLQRLHQGGVRMVALTNSPPAVVEHQLAKAGIRIYFEQVFSVDAVRCYKPAPQPYEMVAKELGVETKSLLMVAAHSWDIAGAMHAGFRAAFIARPGQVLDALAPKPDYVAADLRELADLILKRDIRGNG